MGEARYYLKARFKTERAARRAVLNVESFLLETGRAQAYWQDNRHQGQVQFWGAFKEQFPLVTKYLGGLVGGDCNNALAGMLSLLEGFL